MNYDEQSLSGRILAIRRALGTPRKPLALQALAAMIAERAGVTVSWESLRRYEADGREPPLKVLQGLAQVDPLRRGLVWLAWGLEQDPHVASDPQPSAPAAPRPPAKSSARRGRSSA